MSIRNAAVLCALLATSCQKSPRQFSRAEVIGEYRTADDQGLALGQDGVFRHCWRSARGPASEVGRWEMETPTTVVLLHGESSRARVDRPFPTMAGPWTEGFLVVDDGGRACLMKGDEPSYAKLDDGQRACP